MLKATVIPVGLSRCPCHNSCCLHCCRRCCCRATAANAPAAAAGAAAAAAAGAAVVVADAPLLLPTLLRLRLLWLLLLPPLLSCCCRCCCSCPRRSACCRSCRCSNACWRCFCRCCCCCASIGSSGGTCTSRLHSWGCSSRFLACLLLQRHLQIKPGMPTQLTSDQAPLTVGRCMAKQGNKLFWASNQQLAALAADGAALIGAQGAAAMQSAAAQAWPPACPVNLSANSSAASASSGPVAGVEACMLVSWPSVHCSITHLHRVACRRCRADSSGEELMIGQVADIMIWNQPLDFLAFRLILTRGASAALPILRKQVPSLAAVFATPSIGCQFRWVTPTCTAHLRLLAVTAAEWPFVAL